MSIDGFLILGAVVGIAALLALLAILRRLQRSTRTLAEHPGLWEGRHYRCPHCAAVMEEGWVLLGRGAIWSPRSAGRPGTFAHIGNALDNTISLSLPPAANMAWHCANCRLLLVDHDKLVKG